MLIYADRCNLKIIIFTFVTFVLLLSDKSLSCGSEKSSILMSPDAVEFPEKKLKNLLLCAFHWFNHCIMAYLPRNINSS